MHVNASQHFFYNFGRENFNTPNRFELDDLPASAVVTLAGSPSGDTVRRAATERGIPRLELHPDSMTAGLFTLSVVSGSTTKPTALRSNGGHACGAGGLRARADDADGGESAVGTIESDTSNGAAHMRKSCCSAGHVSHCDGDGDGDGDGGGDHCATGGSHKQRGWLGRNDTCLLLHTSGTTLKPKLVPITHRYLGTAALCIRSTLQLKSSDVGMNVMPLHHLHGIMVNVLVSAVSGAAVVCTEGWSDAAAFFHHCQKHRATWYSAVRQLH